MIPDIARYANSQNKVSDADSLQTMPITSGWKSFQEEFCPPVGGAQHGSHWFSERALAANM
ncbi:MAG: AIPR family protein [Betaproteobacteria bacterium]|nr:AIPR family protein [Betaproteobacteria bacterium]